MKASGKIIMGAALTVTTMSFVALVIIRDDIQAKFVTDENWKFRTINVGKFNRLEFSSNYHAEIVSGLDYEVEIATNDSTSDYPQVREADSTLYFTSKYADSTTAQKIINVRIKMPVLKSVLGRSGSEILIRNFQADSMIVSIEKGCALKGKDNVIKHLTFRAGDAQLEWTKSP
jgi:Putative auto-transporter adhesin, head GIN domain